MRVAAPTPANANEVMPRDLGPFAICTPPPSWPVAPVSAHSSTMARCSRSPCSHLQAENPA